MYRNILIVIVGVIAFTAAVKVSHKGSSGFYKFDEIPKNHTCSNHN